MNINKYFFYFSCILFMQKLFDYYFVKYEITIKLIQNIYYSGNTNITINKEQIRNNS